MPLILVFLIGACELATLENNVFQSLKPESTSIPSITLQLISLIILNESGLVVFEKTRNVLLSKQKELNGKKEKEKSQTLR